MMLPNKKKEHWKNRVVVPSPLNNFTGKCSNKCNCYNNNCPSTCQRYRKQHRHQQFKMDDNFMNIFIYYNFWVLVSENILLTFVVFISFWKSMLFSFSGAFKACFVLIWTWTILHQLLMGHECIPLSVMTLEKLEKMFSFIQDSIIMKCRWHGWVSDLRQ